MRKDKLKMNGNKIKEKRKRERRKENEKEVGEKGLFMFLHWALGVGLSNMRLD